MFGIGGRFAGAKGMVAMPDLSGKTPSEALAALEAVGLRRSGMGTANTSNSSNGGKVFQQSIQPGYLVDYETEISYDYYIYVAPAAPTPYLCGDWYQAQRYMTSGLRAGELCEPDGSGCYECVGGEGSVFYVVLENRMNYCLNGTPTGNYIVDPNSVTTYYPTAKVVYKSGSCGCCTPTCQPVWNVVPGTGWCGSCSGGKKTYNYTIKNSCTGETKPSTPVTVDCCNDIGCGASYKVSTGTWTYEYRQDCKKDDGACDSNGGGCTPYTKVVSSGCVAHCDIWRDVTSCTGVCGTTKKQSQKCQASDCSYYYNYRTVNCPC